jgi:hypothetical protein
VEPLPPNEIIPASWLKVEAIRSVQWLSDDIASILPLLQQLSNQRESERQSMGAATTTTAMVRLNTITLKTLSQQIARVFIQWQLVSCNEGN